MRLGRRGASRALQELTLWATRSERGVGGHDAQLLQKAETIRVEQRARDESVTQLCLRGLPTLSVQRPWQLRRPHRSRD